MSTLFEILIQGAIVILNLINEMSCNNIPIHDSYEVNVSIECILHRTKVISTKITLRYQFELTILRCENSKFFFKYSLLFHSLSYYFLC